MRGRLSTRWAGRFLGFGRLIFPCFFTPGASGLSPTRRTPLRRTGCSTQEHEQTELYPICRWLRLQARKWHQRVIHIHTDYPAHICGSESTLPQGGKSSGAVAFGELPAGLVDEQAMVVVEGRR